MSSFWFDSPLGEVVCRNCRETWPCHWSAWLSGGTTCGRCKAPALEWIEAKSEERSP